MTNYQVATKVCPECFGTMRRFDYECACGYEEPRPPPPLHRKEVLARQHSEVEKILQTKMHELDLFKRDGEKSADFIQRCRDAMPEGFFKLHTLAYLAKQGKP